MKIKFNEFLGILLTTLDNLKCSKSEKLLIKKITWKLYEEVMDELDRRNKETN